MRVKQKERRRDTRALFLLVKARGPMRNFNNQTHDRRLIFIMIDAGCLSDRPCGNGMTRGPPSNEPLREL